MKKIIQERDRMQKLAGILKEEYSLESTNGVILKVDDDIKSQINNMEIPEDPQGNEMTRLPNEMLHVTITGLGVYKNFKEAFKDFQLPEGFNIPNVVLGDAKFVYREPRDETEGKRATYVVSIKNQDELKSFTDKIYQLIGEANPEPDRFFHITIANNAGGNSFKSIGSVGKKDFMQEVNRMQELAGIESEPSAESEDNKDVQVWFDLDGVLADMQKGLRADDEVNRLKDILDEYIENNLPEYKPLSNDDIKLKFQKELSEDPDNEKVKTLKKLYKNYNNQIFRYAGKGDFFYNLELMPKAKELVKRAHEITGVMPNVLSSPTGNENNPDNPSVKGKKAWVEEHFGGMFNVVEITTDKPRVIKSNRDILIDDRKKNTSKFEAAGGSAIVYINATNAIKDLENLYNKLTQS